MSIDTTVVEPANTPYVPLSAALTWMAFRHALDASELRAAVVGVPVIDCRTNDERLRDFFSSDAIEPAAYANHGLGEFGDREAGLARLVEAWTAIRTEVDRGGWELRGRYTPTYSAGEAQLAVPEMLTGSRLAAFSQFHLSTGGIRRQPSGQSTLIWEGEPLAYEREWASATGDVRAGDGYLMVEVLRVPLMTAYPARERGTAPNSQLNRNEIIARATALLAQQPSLSKGSAAASIVAELPPNPKSGKPRDSRHIERMIAPLWEGGLSESLP